MRLERIELWVDVAFLDEARRTMFAVVHNDGFVDSAARPRSRSSIECGHCGDRIFSSAGTAGFVWLNTVTEFN